MLCELTVVDSIDVEVPIFIFWDVSSIWLVLDLVAWFSDIGLTESALL